MLYARFSVKRMRALANSNNDVAIIANRLVSQNPNVSEKEILRVVYNNVVLPNPHVRNMYTSLRVQD